MHLDYITIFFIGASFGAIVSPLLIKKEIKRAHERAKKELSNHADKCQRELRDYANALRGR